MVHEYSDGSMAIYHGKRRVGSYDSEGRLKTEGEVSKAKARMGGHRSFTSPSRATPCEAEVNKAKADKQCTIKADSPFVINTIRARASQPPPGPNHAKFP